MKTILTFLLISYTVIAAEFPTLHFDEKITWKQVFDDGFRPKHLPGLESNRCVIYDQSFFVKFKDRESSFRVDTGRLSFSFYYDDFVSMLWHQGTVAITLAEGKMRAEEFRRVFDGYIVQEIVMPQLIDPSGLVDAGNGKNNITARVGEYRIYYGFDNSMRSDKPIIPHFNIAWSFPGQPDHRSKDPDDVVRPPKGYEWYSLNPKVNTPDPGSEAAVSLQQAVLALGSQGNLGKESRNPDLDLTQPNASLQKPHWSLIIACLLLLISITFYVIRKFFPQREQ